MLKFLTRAMGSIMLLCIMPFVIISQALAIMFQTLFDLIQYWITEEEIDE